MIDFSKIPSPEKIEALCNDIEAARILRDSVNNLGKKDEFQPIIDKQLAKFKADKIEDEQDSGAVVASNAVDLNIDGARRALRVFDSLVSEMERQAKELIVNSTESAQVATEMLAQTKNLEDKITARRKEIIDVPDKFVRKTNAFVKPFIDRLEAIEGKGGIINRKLADYSMKVKLRDREIERKQNEARVELQKQVDAEAKAKGVETVVLPPVAVPTKKEPVRSDSAVASSRIITIGEIKNLSEVPRNYLEAVFRKQSNIDGDGDLDVATEAIWSRLGSIIMEAFNAGLREIPGVEFKEKSIVSVRRVG